MKVKIMVSTVSSVLEERINSFMENKEFSKLDVKITMNDRVLVAAIIYEEKREK